LKYSFIQFSIRVGSGSDVGKCPAVTDPGEEVLLQFSCDGGVTWSILKQFSIDEYRQPGSVIWTNYNNQSFI